MFNAKPESSNYNELITNIETGRVKIPQFQRKFVWSLDMTVKLLDSIVKGYPIGSFILWKTKDRLRSIRNVGGVNLPEPPKGDMIQYVLDGQQRMTSLYVAMKGLKIHDDERSDDFAEIYVDLEAKDDEPIVIYNTEGKPADTLVRFTDLLNSPLVLIQKYPNCVSNPDYVKKMTEYSGKVTGYQFSVISVSDAPIEIATEIFTRLNVGGKALSVFEIMVAKTYDAALNFDLAEKYDSLIKDLEKTGYETISSSVVLQAVSACLCKECAKKHILKLNKTTIINEWDKIISAFKGAVDYMYSGFRIPVSQLLPYDAILVPFTYYFYKHKGKVTVKHGKYLQDYFWRCVMTTRYSSGLESKLAQDIKQIDIILDNQKPTYEDPVDISVEFLETHGWFSAGSSFVKGILCLLASCQPKSFDNNSDVRIDNSWLKQSNSKNYHHFFPKAYLKKQGYEDADINHIANITIVDDFLNKNMIRDKAPSKYIGGFMKKNPDLKKTLKTHLIGDPNAWGVMSNDYDKFFKKRLKKFHDELESRLILTKNDRS